MIDLLLLQASMFMLRRGVSGLRFHGNQALPLGILLTGGYVYLTLRWGATPGMRIADFVVDRLYRAPARDRDQPSEEIVYPTAVAPVEPRPATPPIRPAFADLAYGNSSPLQTLDLYLPAPGSAPAPLVIWIHGGALRVGDKRSMPRVDFGPPPKPRGRNGPYQIQVPDVATLTAKGYAVVSLNYRLGPSMRSAATPAIEDAKAGVRFLRVHAAQYGLDPDKFAAWGNSAGGYLAAMLGVTGDQPTEFDHPAPDAVSVSSAVQAVVVWFGAEDRLFLPRLDITSYLSSAHHLPPFLIANGDADPVISPHQAKRLHRSLLKAGASSHLTILHGAGHEDPAFMATQMSPTFAFLDKVFGRSP